MRIPLQAVRDAFGKSAARFTSSLLRDRQTKVHPSDIFFLSWLFAMHLVSQQFGLLHLSSAIGKQKYTHLTYSSQSLLLYDCRHALRVNLQ
jgi:hypothetical protein